MDPIRTAVKYSLIPLRTVVQLGELFVASGEHAATPAEPPQAPPRAPRPAQKRAQAARRPTSAAGQQPRKVQGRPTNEPRSVLGEDLPVAPAREAEGHRPTPLGSNGSGS